MPDEKKSKPHARLTAADVIDGAVTLTRQSHLFSWSIRDLARHLGVNQSSIYHHVGGKDRLCREVVEEAMGHMTAPDPALDWQDYFRELLLEIGTVAMQYPGVAKWITMHGPTIQAALPTMGAGLRTLMRAGFRSATSQVNALLLNNALLTIAMGDDRLQHEEDGPRDHAAMMREFERIAANIPGVQSFGNDMIRPFADGGETAAQARMSYYRFVIDMTIIGLETALSAGRFTDD